MQQPSTKHVTQCSLFAIPLYAIIRKAYIENRATNKFPKCLFGGCALVTLSKIVTYIIYDERQAKPTWDFCSMTTHHQTLHCWMYFAGSCYRPPPRDTLQAPPAANHLSPLALEKVKKSDDLTRKIGRMCSYDQYFEKKCIS